VVSVVSNIVPDRVSALCEAFNGDNWSEARRLHRDLFPLSRGLLSLDVNPVPIKTAMRLLGRDTGALRLPLCEPASAVTDRISQMLDDLGLRIAGGAAAVKRSLKAAAAAEAEALG
jgi:4-hydroxy-tetrahydrodipicolinate synthase